MTGLLHWSSSVYSGMLHLYPEDIRRHYGQEMASVFSEDLAGSWDDAGFFGVFQVWRCAILELVHLALPRLATAPSVIVPAICFVLSSLCLGGELTLAHLHASTTGSSTGYTPLDEAIRTVVLWPSITAALVSWIAVRAGRGKTISLAH